jgi:hypothetical protein
VVVGCIGEIGRAMNWSGWGIIGRSATEMMRRDGLNHRRIIYGMQVFKSSGLSMEDRFYGIKGERAVEEATSSFPNFPTEKSNF